MSQSNKLDIEILKYIDIPHDGGDNVVSPIAIVTPHVCCNSPERVKPASQVYVAFVPFSDISILPSLGSINVEQTENNMANIC
jgi:hypothetical protein